MTRLYVYAILGAAPVGPLGAGARGEPLRLVDCGDVLAATGTLSEVPPLDPDALREHDATVRRLAGTTDAVLPVRFGSLVENESTLIATLEPARSRLREALDLVAGREQMTLRLYGEPVMVEASDRPPDAPGAGARYLEGRHRVWKHEHRLPEIQALRPILDRLVVAERIERHHTPPLVASAYHLIARGAAPEYALAVQAGADVLGALRVAVSGPWPPYAFAPEVLS